jgi:hypothetical protein
MTRRRTAQRGAAGILLALSLGAAGALACGHYGPPVRAREYREKEQEQTRAEEQREKGSTPESRNDPLPSAP